jgi:hypothetical protein
MGCSAPVYGALCVLQAPATLMSLKVALACQHRLTTAVARAGEVVACHRVSRFNKGNNVRGSIPGITRNALTVNRVGGGPSVFDATDLYWVGVVMVPGEDVTNVATSKCDLLAYVLLCDTHGLGYFML